MTLAADTAAIYKGRKYRLAWAGDTKYGQRAKLQFFDGSKEFWVDYSKIQVLDGSQRSSGRSSRKPRRSGYCEECGDYFSGPKQCWETGLHCYAL